MKEYKLEDRLIKFSVQIINCIKTFEQSDVGKYLANQIARSAISSSLNYGEAKGAESRRDFIHKLKISLKELHETSVTLRIIEGCEITKDKNGINSSLDECRELIAIVSKSILTAKKNSRALGTQ